MASKPSGIGYLPVLKKGISSVTATPEHDPGTRVQYQGDEYTYIYNKATSTAPVGYAMGLSASTGYSATISAATDQDLAFGVVKHVDIEPAEYGWIVTRGFAPIVPGLNTGLAQEGEHVKMVSTSNTGNMARVAAQTLYSQLAGSTVHPFGVVVQTGDTAGSNGNGTIYIW